MSWLFTALMCPVSQFCLAPGVPVGVVPWANQVGELLFLLQHGITHFAVLRVQLAPGEMLHDASAQGIPQHVGGRSKAVPEKSDGK